MKNNLIKILSVLSVLFISVSSSFAAEALVLSTTGTVEIGRDGNWKPCTRGAIISEGDVISTGFKSEAIIKFNGSSMKLGSLTQVTLEQLASNEKKDSVSVYLSTGSVRSTVKHTSNKKVSYTVRNPVAVASVRGTKFSFNSDGHIKCYEGAVVVYPAKLFNPAAHGIRKPADGKPGASEEQIRKSEESTPASGESTEFTGKKDVAPDAPKGGILLTAGHSTNFNDFTTEKPSTPKDSASEEEENFSNAFTTPVSSEEKNPTAGTISSNDINEGSKKNRKAKLNVNIEIQE